VTCEAVTITGTKFGDTDDDGVDAVGSWATDAANKKLPEGKLLCSCTLF
jgi:hypothetical protein